MRSDPCTLLFFLFLFDNALYTGVLTSSSMSVLYYGKKRVRNTFYVPRSDWPASFTTIPMPRVPMGVDPPICRGKSDKIKNPATAHSKLDEPTHRSRTLTRHPVGHGPMPLGYCPQNASKRDPRELDDESS